MPQSHSLPVPRTGVYYTEPGEKKRAQQLADSLGLPLSEEYGFHDFVLVYVNDRLCLSMSNEPLQKGHMICAEFVRGAAGYRRKRGQKEMLLRAIGYRRDNPPAVLDATGGLGKDCFLMAGHGCVVHVLERNRIVFALLQDGLRRAAEHPDTAAIADSIRLTMQDSEDYLNALADGEKKYDVVYLDPMFPERSKSALVKKEMQMLQKLLDPQNDSARLVSTALAAAGRRVVVKRPGKAPPLTGPAPSHSLTGRTTRYDVYMVPR